MIEIRTKNKCRWLRAWMRTVVSKSIGPEANWLNEHIIHCPKCQQRLISSGRVNLALSFMKSQPHGLDLLMRANTQAINVLKHSLRNEPKALKLETKLPEPKLFEKCSKYGHYLANLAACIVILLLMKIGVFSSMDQFQNQGQRVMKQYYAKQVGEDLANEVFPKDTKSSSPVSHNRLTNA